MFSRNLLLYVALTGISFLIARAQDCDVEGEICVDHEQCCGGCCFNGVCYNTYQSCLQPLDVCRDHICLGEENCMVYLPPHCPGCEPVPICV